MATPPRTEHLDEVFELVRKREAAAMKATRAWVTTVSDALPVELPLVRELTREFLDFTEELLRIQREFVRDLMVETRAVMYRVSEGGVPAAPAHTGPAPAKARKPAA